MHGPIPPRACGADPRFSSYAYVPRDPAGVVAVLVHGSDRDPKGLRDAFAPWAEASGAALVAPLFPGGIGDPDDLDGYKSVRFGELRFDEVLLAMVDELAERHGLATRRLLMFGFSGGAQFLHRFVLLHPERVLAASIAAPGNVTLIDDGRSWWVGTADVAEQFGRELDLAALRTVRLQTVIGSLDDGRDVIRVRPHEARWIEGANDAGVTRGERLRTLEANWRAHGLDVRTEIVQGVAHEVDPMVPFVTSFFSEVLRVP